MKITYQKYEQVTKEDIRNIDEFKDYDDERVSEILNTIKQLSLIIYENVKPKKSLQIDINKQYLQAA
jgi:hypothetical protein